MNNNIQQMAMNMLYSNIQNPIVSNALQLYQNHDSKGLYDLASNLCKEHGTSFDEMKKKLNIG